MVAALYFGREVLVPIALALLLSFVLAPLVRRLQSWRFLWRKFLNLQTIYRATNQT
jgi:predicted PurR-regulated permease PerM